jgi:hypothetical protein
VIGSMLLLHCVACDDIQYVTAGWRTFCRCERSSARSTDNHIVVAGPGRIVGPGGDGPADMEIEHRSVAVGT